MIGAYSLEHYKERYDNIIGDEWYIFVLQQVVVPRNFLLCHLFGVFVFHTKMGQVYDS